MKRSSIGNMLLSAAYFARKAAPTKQDGDAGACERIAALEPRDERGDRAIEAVGWGGARGSGGGSGWTAQPASVAQSVSTRGTGWWQERAGAACGVAAGAGARSSGALLMFAARRCFTPAAADRALLHASADK